MDSSPIVRHLLNSTINPGQPLDIKWPPSGPLLCIRPPRGHLIGKVCPGFVVEFSKCCTIGDESMSLTSLLQGVPQICFLQY